MSTQNSNYITTPIYYASGHPHLGHAYSTILADCLARYSRLRGYDTKFTTGMDEHGLKIERIAQKEGVEPQALVDKLATVFQTTWQTLGIKPDDFIRTTESRHKATAQAMWEKMAQNDDIYLGSYEGDYCVDCEEYYQKGELINETDCPIHNRPVERISEESYFFKLSKYAPALIDHIESNPNFIQPQTRRNEVLAFLKGNTIRDLSISRTSFKWGVPVPGDDKHVMYVWVDALVNYLSSLGGLESPDLAKFWPNTTHIIGKDILRFHAVYWPAMLLSAGLPLPKHLVVHGWWTIQDKKISKSEPATKVDPTIFVPDLSTDGIRFFLLHGLHLGSDGNLSFEDLIQEVNVHLVNNIANCLNRFCHMVFQNFEGKIEMADYEALQAEDEAILATLVSASKSVEEQMNKHNPAAAIEPILGVSSALNTYIEDMTPWNLAKDPQKKGRLATVFGVIAAGLTWLAHNGSPFFPVLASKIAEQCGVDGPITWQESGQLRPLTIQKGEVFLERIKAQAAEALIEKWKASGSN